MSAESSDSTPDFNAIYWDHKASSELNNSSSFDAGGRISGTLFFTPQTHTVSATVEPEFNEDSKADQDNSGCLCEYSCCGSSSRSLGLKENLRVRVEALEKLCIHIESNYLPQAQPAIAFIYFSGSGI